MCFSDGKRAGLSGVSGLSGCDISWLFCCSVGAVVYVYNVRGTAWPILLSPCNTAEPVSSRSLPCKDVGPPKH